jgi:hypothetical protein
VAVYSLAPVSRLRFVAAALGLVVGYAFAIRPRLLRSGATDEQVRRRFPGAELVPGGTTADLGQ